MGISRKKKPPVVTPEVFPAGFFEKLARCAASSANLAREIFNRPEDKERLCGELESMYKTAVEEIYKFREQKPPRPHRSLYNDFLFPLAEQFLTVIAALHSIGNRASLVYENQGNKRIVFVNRAQKTLDILRGAADKLSGLDKCILSLSGVIDWRDGLDKLRQDFIVEKARRLRRAKGLMAIWLGELYREVKDDILDPLSEIGHLMNLYVRD